MRLVVELGVGKEQSAKHTVGNGSGRASGSGTGRGQGPKCEEYSGKREAGVRVAVELGVDKGQHAKNIGGNGNQGCEW